MILSVPLWFRDRLFYSRSSFVEEDQEVESDDDPIETSDEVGFNPSFSVFIA